MSYPSIVFIHEKFPFGGGEEVTINIAPYLKEKGYKISILSCSINRVVPGVELVQLPDKRKVDTPENLKFITHFLNQNNSNVLVLPSDYIKNISALRVNPTIKIIFILHSIPLWRATFKYNLSKAKSRKTLFKRMNWLFIDKLKYDILKIHLLKQKRRCKKIYKMADAYFVLSTHYKEEVESILNLSKESRIKVVPNSVRKANIEEEELLLKKKEILYVGRLSYVDKRVDRLLEIWKNLYKSYPDWTLRIIGEGPEEANLKQYVKENGIDQIRFEGAKEDLSPYYKQASISCLTSTFEGWPLSLAESQSYGVVPIAFNCAAGIADILSPNEENGMLVAPFDLKEYEMTLRKVMDNSELRQRIAHSVFKKAKDYSPETISKRWIEMLEKLLSE